jgi:hypothetical protein
MTSEQLLSAFSRYCDVYKFDDFWTRGNTFDALLHVYKSAKERWRGDPRVSKMDTLLRAVAIENIDYLGSRINADYWADDYGWWGIAALSARDYFKGRAEPELAAKYLKLARQCWDSMQKGYDKSPAAKPVPYGCGNSNGSRTGTKNTVTNATLFLLSQRLYQIMTPDPVAVPYLQMAYRQYNWFNNWFNLPGNDYFKTFQVQLPPKGLVQERPIAPPDYEQQYMVPQWEPGWVWTGDQGLLLGGLIEFLSIAGSSADAAEFSEMLRETDADAEALVTDLRQQISLIMYGVSGLLVGADNVLREAPFNSSFNDDPKDYVCGRGVLFRYISEHHDYLGTFFDDIIKATGEAVWDSGNTGGTSPNYQFAADWTPGENQPFNEAFKKIWGFGDPVTEWSLGTPNNMINGILQAAGLDVIGSAIRFA